MKSWIALTLLVFLSAKALAKDEKFVAVTGECTKSLVPNRGSIQLISESLDSNPGLATQKVIESYNKTRERLKKMKIPGAEFETIEFSVNEEIDWNQGKKRSNGYKARMGLKITTSDLKILGELATVGAELKTPEIRGLSQFVAPETIKSEYESCLEEALTHAKNKAQKLAKAAGQTIGSALHIIESGGIPGARPEFDRGAIGGVMKMASESMASSVPQIESGISRLTVNIQASFELR
jgi:uncharacterized protein YggE